MASVHHSARPLVIGVAGDSGTGKDHLCATLKALFGASRTAVISGDDYHLWERGDARWGASTPSSPQASDLGKLAADAEALAAGRSIEQRVYRHDCGRFSAPVRVAPRPTLIVQGLHALYTPELRARCDLRVFLQPSESLRVRWKIARDIRERGHDEAAVRDSILRRRLDGALHIAPQREHADWVIELDDVGGRLEARHVFRDPAVLDGLGPALRRLGVSGAVGASCLHAREGAEPASIAALAAGLFPDLADLTGGLAPTWRRGLDGVTQLVALAVAAARAPASTWREAS